MENSIICMKNSIIYLGFQERQILLEHPGSLETCLRCVMSLLLRDSASIHLVLVYAAPYAVICCNFIQIVFWGKAGKPPCAPLEMSFFDPWFLSISDCQTRPWPSGCIWITGMCSPDFLVTHFSGRDAAGFKSRHARARSLARSLDRSIDSTRPDPTRHGTAQNSARFFF